MSSAAGSFVDFLAAARPAIDAALDRLLPPSATRPARLHQAMRYSVLAGGKRLRPALVLLSGELFGAARERTLAPAAAVELVHTFSLVHDDLPALDDDDLRRGRATLHRAFDEATAILAGDALLTLGLTTLAALPEELSAATRCRVLAIVGEAIGSAGMIGGQVEDLEAEASWPAEPAAALERIHRGKTAALFSASLRLGGLYAGAGAETELQLAGIGERLGLLFQIGDDLLDVVGSTAALGKTAGKDALATKLTYPALYGVEESRAQLAKLTAELRREVAALPVDATLLVSLVEYLERRES